MKTRIVSILAIAAVSVLGACGAAEKKSDGIVKPAAAESSTTTTLAPASSSTTAKPTTTTTEAEPVTTTTAASKSVSYANCSAVKAAGAAPIRRGDPGYSTSLDRDGDGVACES